MAKILAPQVGINPFHQSVIDLRARLIAQEALFDAQTKRMLNDLFKQWESFLKNPSIIGRSVKDYPKALAARRLAILQGIKRITGKSVTQFTKSIADRALPIFNREYIRHASLLDQYVTTAERKILRAAGKRVRANASAAAAFHQIDQGAVRAALADPITGIMKASVVKATVPVFTERARIDLATTIAEGKGVDDLLIRWKRSVNLAGHNPQAIARTALMSASQNATSMLYVQNTDIIKALQWEATFDSRTCVICGSNHGRQWPITQQPPMPAHLQCRCTLIPIFRQASLNEQNIIPKRDVWGNVDFAKGDRRFDTWMRKQSSIVQYQFFGSNLKHKSWRNGWVDMSTLVKPDLSVMTDVELTQHLFKGKQTPTKLAIMRSILAKYSKNRQAKLAANAANSLEKMLNDLIKD